MSKKKDEEKKTKFAMQSPLDQKKDIIEGAKVRAGSEKKKKIQISFEEYEKEKIDQAFLFYQAKKGKRGTMQNFYKDILLKEADKILEGVAK